MPAADQTVLACPEIVEGGAQNARPRTLDRPLSLGLRWSGGCAIVGAKFGDRFVVASSYPRRRFASLPPTR
jgi:hypothetical protein